VLGLRPLHAAVAATILLAAGVVAGIVLSGSDSGTRRVPAIVRAPGTPGARASLSLGADGNRLEVQDFPPPPRGRVYQVWLKPPGNRPPEPTDALFTVHDGAATVAVPGRLDDVEQVLVTDEPTGGSRAPTRKPVIIATLS
jgi:hypothetical protein